MKAAILNTLLFACANFDLDIAKAAVTGTDKDFDIDVMVETLRQIENWDGRSRGAAGERGPWQVTQAVWMEITDMPFSWTESWLPAQRSETRRVAREHVYRIKSRLIAAGLPVTAYTVAIVWCAGWNAFFYGQPHKPSRAKRDYATRASNLYHDLDRNFPEP